MTRVLNVFETVRPRGQARPSVVPRAGHGLLLDAKGVRRVPLAPRSNGAFFIESGAVALAASNKRSALLKGGI